MAVLLGDYGEEEFMNKTKQKIKNIISDISYLVLVILLLGSWFIWGLLRIYT